jgi:23S rRNA pseudouridine1911/1915/1917 synthase
MIVAKTEEAHTRLSEQIKARTVSRQYTAIVHGRFRALSGTIEAPIGRHRKDRKKMAVDHDKGRYACSLYQVIEQYREHALLHVDLKTGRTHQIRVHLKSIHHPVVGDQVYGDHSKNNINMSRQALHARRIRFKHPISREQMEFETPLPEDMRQVLEKLRMMSHT